MTVRTKGYDNIAVNHQQRLALPFAEVTGTITHDLARPHHLLTLIDTGGGSFTWGNLVTGLPYLQWAAVGGGPGDGVYLNCPAADTADLNFTTEDYSIGGWINWDSTGGWSEIIIGRYSTNVDGWDIYLNISGGLNTLSHRHHHTPDNSQCYSAGWTPGTWYFMGVSRIGTSVVHYRNSVPLAMTPTATGMLDPDTANRDLSLGVRGTTKDANWYRGMMWDLRVWGDRALSQEDWEYIYETERHWFNV